MSIIDDTAKGDLTQFQELFAVIPCASKDCYLKTVGSQIKNEDYLKLEQTILRFLAQNIKRQQS